MRNGLGVYREILQNMRAAVKCEDPNLISWTSQYAIQETVKVLKFSQLRGGIMAGLYHQKKRPWLRNGVAETYLLFDAVVFDGKITCRKVIGDLSRPNLDQRRNRHNSGFSRRRRRLSGEVQNKTYYPKAIDRFPHRITRCGGVAGKVVAEQLSQTS